MKNFKYSILIATALMSLAGMTGTAKADPSIILKAGGWAGAASSHSSGVTHGFIYAIEASECTHCISPYFINLSGDAGKNAGLGLDYVYKAGNPNRGLFRFAAGGIRFKDPLNEGERNNFHAGLSFELPMSKKTSILFSYDHYSNGRNLFNREETVDINIPTHLLTLGFHFK